MLAAVEPYRKFRGGYEGEKEGRDRGEEGKRSERRSRGEQGEDGEKP